MVKVLSQGEGIRSAAKDAAARQGQAVCSLVCRSVRAKKSRRPYLCMPIEPYGEVEMFSNEYKGVLLDQSGQQRCLLRSLTCNIAITGSDPSSCSRNTTSF